MTEATMDVSAQMQLNQPEQHFGWTDALKVAGVVTVGALAVSSCNDNSNGLNAAGHIAEAQLHHEASTRTAVEQAVADACPEGMFAANDISKISDVLPHEMHARAKNALTDNESFLKYTFGDKAEGEPGTLCLLPSEIGFFVTVFNNWAGAEGTGARPFSDFNGDVNAERAFYAAHPDKAAAVFADPTFQAFMANIVPNAKLINSGAYFNVYVQPDDTVVQEPVQLPDMPANTVLVLQGEVPVGDDIHNSTDRLIIDMKTQQVWLLKTLGGAATISPEASTTTTTTLPEGGTPTSNPNRHTPVGPTPRRRAPGGHTVGSTVGGKAPGSTGPSNTVGTIPTGTIPIETIPKPTIPEKKKPTPTTTTTPPITKGTVPCDQNVANC